MTLNTQVVEGPKQPIHPSVLPKLDPEYIAFHNEYVANVVPLHTLPWDPAIRNTPAVPGTSEPLKVGKTQDFDLSKAKIRTFTPEGPSPQDGWPGFIFFHGGGWTLGNIASATSFCTNMAIRAKCVVISVDYRLAPENPYPSAIEDAVDALHWVNMNGEKELGVNLNQIAVGGTSSGGNIAAVLALKNAQMDIPIPFIFQLLIVPVTDNTADVATSSGWADNQFSPWLSPARMLWFRNNYLPNEEDLRKWDASPIFAPDDLLAKLPKTWIAVAELDILKEEGINYAERIKKAGVEVEIHVYKGVPHPLMAMDGVLQVGKQLVTDAAEALKNAFYPQ
ncbi:hypothetical protein M413DRAFT_449327 [Hebeloma cylindrosporum]|uniref:Alpha/beta hydrolase fold-3 domain-containing protein n=1 Tax=Hebeloma cylindrosporum TaxID=76867 RepID=A0A0C2Y5F0_HEBCY|nr:hypothetical protein M413DRAFT_449327 [Hebeloma cylindrosporum h7]